MYVLIHSNVDTKGPGSIWDKWKKEPTQKQLKEVLGDCHEDEGELTEIIRELLSSGECHVDNGDCTVYSLEEI
jgi:phosphoribosyl-AMP cyclohydrolase